MWCRWCSGRRASCSVGPGCLVCPWAVAFLLLLRVVPLVFWAPEGPAAREARRPHVVRRRASKPARALRSLRRPPHRRRLLGASARCPARPCRHPRALRPGPSGPPGALHTGGACLVRRLVVRPGPAATPLVSCPDLACRIAESTPNFACNSPKALSNREIRSLEFQRFGALLNVQAIELHATVLGVWSYALVMSHAIPSGVFHGVRPDRWNSADYAVVLAGVGLESHAELGRPLFRGLACCSEVLHYIGGRCTT